MSSEGQLDQFFHDDSYADHESEGAEKLAATAGPTGGG